jgi:hypothetical protein
MKWNRKVHFRYFNKESKDIYALGSKDSRKAILLFNKNIQSNPEKKLNILFKI